MIVVDGTLNPDASVAWIFGQLPIDAQEDARRSWSAGSAAR
jgi:hypothetical protein